MRSLIASIAIIVMLAMVTGGCNRQTAAPPENVPPSDQSQEVFQPTSYKVALQLAQQHKRNLVLVFSANWCKPCKEMKAGVWPNHQVQEALSPFIVYFVDVDRERGVADEHGVRTIPSYGIFSVTAGQPKRLKFGSGQRSASEIVTWLQ